MDLSPIRKTKQNNFVDMMNRSVLARDKGYGVEKMGEVFWGFFLAIIN